MPFITSHVSCVLNCKMANPSPSRIVLIGSRALNHHLPERKINGKETDYDFIATSTGALNWIASLPTLPTIQTVEYPLERATHNKDIEHDISHWKHLDKSKGLEIYASQLNELTHIKKIIGHTNLLKFEIEIIQPYSSASLVLSEMMCEHDAFQPTSGNSYEIASLPVLEAIKTSHIIFPYNWRTHMADLNLIRKQLGRDESGSVKRSTNLQRLIIHRRLEHYLRLGVPGSNINLNKSSEDFLENETVLYVDKYIAHDDIHLRVMIDGQAPAYSELRPDKSKAYMSKELFDNAQLQVRLNCVREEVMSIALERYLLPDRESDAQKAYTKAYIRVCTTLTKGWFREFAIDVHHLIYELNVDLMKIKREIRAEHAQTVAEAQRLEQVKADRIRSVQDILDQSFTRDLNYRKEYLLPIFFTNPKELKLAQMMVGATSSLDYDSYRCNLPGRGIDMVFSAGTEYEYNNGGWCDNHNEWKAYVMALPTWVYEAEREDCYNLLSPTRHDLEFDKESKIFQEALRLGFTMSTRADDSWESTPDIDNLKTRSFNDLMTHNQSLTSQFLMKFIICVTYPAKFTSNGQTGMPKSPIHYLYEIWRKDQKLPEEPVPSQCNIM
jgi:hypothetical protein